MQIVIEGKDLIIIDYDEKFGNHNLSKDFILSQKGKTIAEQLTRFKVAEKSSICYFSYGKENGGKRWFNESEPHKNSDVLGVVVDDGVVVGLWVKQWYRSQAPLFVGESVCTYSVVDEDGTGRDERDDYIILLVN